MPSKQKAKTHPYRSVYSAIASRARIYTINTWKSTSSRALYSEAFRFLLTALQAAWETDAEVKYLDNGILVHSLCYGSSRVWVVLFFWLYLGFQLEELFVFLFNYRKMT